MPVDFLPYNAGIDKAQSEHRTRIFHTTMVKVEDDDKSKFVYGKDSGELLTRIQNFRKAACRWGARRTEIYFAEKLSKEFPDLRVDGRKITSPSDFCELIKKGPWNNELRGAVAYASWEMWEKQFTLNLEVEFCKMMNITFTGLKCNGEPHKRNQKGSCISKLFTKLRSTVVDRIRNTCRKKWCEAIYTRAEKVPKDGAPSTNKADYTKDGVPRLLKQIPATREEHGFDGKLGICFGSTREVAVAAKTPEGGGSSAIGIGTSSAIGGVVGGTVVSSGSDLSTSSPMTATTADDPADAAVALIKKLNNGNKKMTVDELLAALTEATAQKQRESEVASVCRPTPLLSLSIASLV